MNQPIKEAHGVSSISVAPAPTMVFIPRCLGSQGVRTSSLHPMKANHLPGARKENTVHHPVHSDLLC